MRLTLEPPWPERLAGEPESGMGYQRVRVRLRDGRTVEEAIVFNGTVLEVPDGAPTFDGPEIAAPISGPVPHR
ncbi:MAG: hypothetical protein IH878_15855 [Gemmatimonadetes bacterium]|nr:hypothetical protein [Gemmatimonadota bacterium]